MRVQEITATAQLVWVGHSRPTNAEGKITQAGDFRRRCLVLAICTPLLALAPHAAAQRTAHAAAPHPAAPHSNVPAGSFSGRATNASRFRRSSPFTSLPFPFFADSFNPDDIYSTGYPEASQPPVILLQTAGPLTAPAEYASTEPATPQPLVIELQNGRYVRVNSTPSNGEPLSQANTTPPERNSADPCSTVWGQPPRLSSRAQRGACAERALLPAAASPHDLPPALLVFRDGHSEEVRDYTIADGILYARGDYYTDGYWNKKIEITSLNVPQTLEANAQRNVKFALPKSPNEIITRP
jgi:hypothetical protein